MTAAPAPGTPDGPGTPDHRRLAAVGPYFALEVAAAPGAPAPAGFRPLRELYATGPDALLAGRVREVGRRLGTAEPRVAASILQLGLAARFWSVGLGAAMLLGAVPDLDPDRARVRVPDQGPIDLWLPHPWTPHPAPGPAELAEELHRTVVLGQLTPLAAAVRSAAPVAERLLWGNAASALVGALRVLHDHAAASGPEAVRTARDLAERLLEREPLTGTLRAGAAGRGVRRTSCCLYYRIGPGAGVCGDCCFDRPPR
ncbi:(2Fe-2S)-binding protein [Kitasatospora sp. NPDC004240]